MGEAHPPTVPERERLPAAQPPATVRAWYERLAGMGSWPKLRFEEWIWIQDLSNTALSDLGCDPRRG